MDPTGYIVAVPGNYVPTRLSSNHVIWESPTGAVLRIQVTDQQKSDPYNDWKTKAAQRKASGCYREYAELAIKPVGGYFLSAADWEFTYVETGVRQHVRIRGFVTSPTRAYGIWWSTPVDAWLSHVDHLEGILRSFQPGTNPLPSPAVLFTPKPIPCA